MSKKPSRKPAKPKPNRHNPPSKSARRAKVPSAAAAASQSISLLADMLWLLVLLLTVCLALALASFTMEDPAWSRSIPNDAAPRNLAGLAGAYMADVAYYLFGLSVWWLLLAAAVWLYHNFRSVKQSSEKPYHLGMGLGGAALLLFGSPLLEAAAWSAELRESLPMGAGGLIGQSLGSGFTRLLGVSGSLLVQVVLIVAGLSLLLQVSWLTLLEKAGAQLEWLWYKLIRRPHRFVREMPNAKFARRMVRAAKSITAEEVETVAGASSNRKPVTVQISQPAEQGLPEKPAPERQKDLFDPKGQTEDGEYRLPELDLLTRGQEHKPDINPEALQRMAERIEAKLAEFGIQVTVVSATAGPVITRFEIEPAQGVKGSQITHLAKDLARSLSMQSVRVVETISGKSTMGIEVPNEKRQEVLLREILSSPVFAEAQSKLTVALGKDIAGQPVVADLGKMPHLLVGGMTGSGKSVGVNAMIMSILYKAAPDEVRFIMIDPKMLELSVYEGIPHLLCPVVTDMREAGQALNWCVAEMEKRYRLLAHAGVRNLVGFNQKVAEAAAAGKPLPNPFSPNPDEPEPLQKLPYIVIVIDELADLMMTEKKAVETQIARLAQKARAAGMHLIVATQRPSVDVVTGLIKANIPTRMAYTVQSRIDSRTILDQMGAEDLLKYGDLLFLQPGSAEPVRLQGAFVSDHEVHEVASFAKRQQGADYIEGLLSGEAAQETVNAVHPNAGSDEMFDQAVAFILESRKTSISSLQRQLRIGYNRAANLMQALEDAGIVSPADVSGARKILARKDDL
ncbi:DNA translocase FtsK 4TM domain-containing protein [Eikenella sp. S3360]|uniref:DNA translocase FtsK 4TM domain-containing protein n=1 Tax=Eikenella glucosivorans TaxID=2766967 RepID=A0ABS0NBX3_9NEIS|nr:DNA translocase FtsK [Eikenella glucosivorans]MBH5329828.1 DNA translocase FtsK 4TM domain-containing protein [Eikenella glucosivorans]